jgi:hypothetical protein
MRILRFVRLGGDLLPKANFRVCHVPEVPSQQVPASQHRSGSDVDRVRFGLLRNHTRTNKFSSQFQYRPIDRQKGCLLQYGLPFALHSSIISV